jgi:hypothetical protein
VAEPAAPMTRFADANTNLTCQRLQGASVWLKLHARGRPYPRCAGRYQGSTATATQFAKLVAKSTNHRLYPKNRAFLRRLASHNRIQSFALLNNAIDVTSRRTYRCQRGNNHLTIGSVWRDGPEVCQQRCQDLTSKEQAASPDTSVHPLGVASRVCRDRRSVRSDRSPRMFSGLDDLVTR